MKKDLKRKLNKSFQKLFRNRHIKAKELDLSDQEYRLWDLLLALYDWDQTHTETFGTVEATQLQLAELLNCSDPKVCRLIRSLIKKGLIKKIEESVYQVTDLQNSSSFLQEESSVSQDLVADLKEKQGYDSNSPLVSFKDNTSFVRSNKEYEELQRQFPNLTVEDMKWIDLNVN